MTRPAVSPAAESTYRLLPDYVRAGDEDAAWTVLAFTAAISTGLDPARALLDASDPDTSVSGTCEPVNPARADRRFLPWLGWLVGIDTSTLPAGDVRAALAAAAVTQRRGSVDAIAAAVRRTLTGSRDVAVIAKPADPDITPWAYDTANPYDSARRYDGGVTDPYLIVVITKAAQTPDEPATLAAALTEKPAGMNLELRALTAATYNDLSSRYGTYSAMTATGRTYDDLASTFT
jgi:hypothetical protein